MYVIYMKITDDRLEKFEIKRDCIKEKIDTFFG